MLVTPLPLPNPRWLRFLPALILAVAAASPVLADPGGAVRVGGSDLLGDSWSDGLRAVAAAAEVPLDLRMEGSARARRALQEERLDLAVLAIPQGETAPEGFESIPLAFQVAVIIVHATNPLNELSLGQLAGIFGSAPEGPSIAQWGGLQLGGAWNTRTIAPVALRETNGLTLELFRKEVLGASGFRTSVRFEANPATVLRVVGDDPGAIGVVGMLPATHPRVRVLPLRTREGQVAFTPTAESVEFGDYPIRLPFVLVYDPLRKSVLRPLIHWLLSDDAAQLLEDRQLMPLPRNERQERRMLIDIDL